MREILFRGKKIDDGKWEEGFLLKYALIYGEQTYILPLWSVCESGTEVDPETVCQYTGLTDKNGRKIFEGDIVRDIFNASVIGIVRYGEYRNTFKEDEFGGHTGFYVDWKEKANSLRKDLVFWVNNSEFIGNIFDNPELAN